MICHAWHGMLYEMFCDASESVCRLRNALFHLSPSNKIPDFSHANDGVPEAFEENRKLVWKLADSLTRLTSKAFFQLLSTNTVPRFWFAGRPESWLRSRIQSNIITGVGHRHWVIVSFWLSILAATKPACSFSHCGWREFTKSPVSRLLLAHTFGFQLPLY